MSNPSVGQVYAQVIRDVVETSRLDFEEGGVDESVLEELSMGWQRKLSELRVAQFPWDPKPEPPRVPVSNPPTVAPNYPQIASPVSQAQTTFSIPPLPSMQPMTNSSNGPHIKTEPSIDRGLHLPSYGGGPLTAQQRAAQNLAATFGPRAAASISAIQTGIPQQSQHQSQQQIQQGQQQSQQQQQQRQGISAQRPPLTQTHYQQAMALQAAQQRSQIQNQGGVNGSQTDGSGDADVDALGPFMRTNTSGQGQIGRVEIDRMVRQKIEAMSHSIEGGGLMLPLKEPPLKECHSDAGRKRLKTNDSRAVTPVHGFMASRTPTANLQYDVVGDDNGEKLRDEELDEDAINSELDDSDDGGNEEEDDDDSMGNIMLCMYDKVQRVKNKWKCVMKDGVLTVNGKEYVFHKATGEYEW